MRVIHATQNYKKFLKTLVLFYSSAMNVCGQGSSYIVSSSVLPHANRLRSPERLRKYLISGRLGANQNKT
jgi:hypothetical protein